MLKNTSGLFGLFYGLHKLKPRSFQGTIFRDLPMTREHIQKYEWACRYNTKRIIYTRSFWSTSVDHRVAQAFSNADPNVKSAVHHSIDLEIRKNKISLFK